MGVCKGLENRSVAVGSGRSGGRYPVRSDRDRQVAVGWLDQIKKTLGG